MTRTRRPRAPRLAASLTRMLISHIRTSSSMHTRMHGKGTPLRCLEIGEGSTHRRCPARWPKHMERFPAPRIHRTFRARPLYRHRPYTSTPPHPPTAALGAVLRAHQPRTSLTLTRYADLAAGYNSPDRSFPGRCFPVHSPATAAQPARAVFFSQPHAIARWPPAAAYLR